MPHFPRSIHLLENIFFSSGLGKLYDHSHNRDRFRILCYHKISPDDTSAQSVHPATFESQLRYLQQRYHLVPLADVQSTILFGIPLDPRALALTFDDGHRNNYTHLFPILKKFRVPASVFLVEQYIRTQKPFPYSRETAFPLTVPQIHEMIASGLVSFYPHTSTHLLLTQLSPREVRRELESSKTFIKTLYADLSNYRSIEVSKYRADIIAYPFGQEGFHFTERTKRIARACGYSLGVSVDTEFSKRAAVDPFAVKRIVCIEEPMSAFALRTIGLLAQFKKMIRARPSPQYVPHAYHPTYTL